MPDDPQNPPAPDPATPDAPAQDTTEVDWKAEARKWESRAKQNKEALDAASPKLAEYDRLIEAGKSDLDRATEEAQRWQAETDKWRHAAVGSRIEALASTDFADPSDAAAALSDPAKYLDAGGQINEQQIRTDLAALLERKPHWRRQEGPQAPRVPAPNPAQGSSGNPPAADPRAAFAAVLQGEMNRSR